MGRKPAPPDEYHLLLKEAREALDRMRWTDRDRLWLKKLSLLPKRA